MSKQFEHAADIQPQQGSVDNFTGTVNIRAIASGKGEPVGVNRVTFQSGGRTHWHTHSGEQVLYFLEGKGRFQIRGETAIDAQPGDVARIPIGTEHWHGAHPDEPEAMTHLAITFGEPTWLDPVSDEDYQS